MSLPSTLAILSTQTPVKTCERCAALGFLPVFVGCCNPLRRQPASSPTLEDSSSVSQHTHTHPTSYLITPKVQQQTVHAIHVRSQTTDITDHHHHHEGQLPRVPVSVCLLFVDTTSKILDDAFSVPVYVVVVVDRVFSLHYLLR